MLDSCSAPVCPTELRKSHRYCLKTTQDDLYTTRKEKRPSDVLWEQTRTKIIGKGTNKNRGHFKAKRQQLLKNIKRNFDIWHKNKYQLSISHCYDQVFVRYEGYWR